MNSSDQVLKDIADSLKAIAQGIEKVPEPPLGFIQPPKPVWIYANRNQTDSWYTLNADRQAVVCPSNALAGQITDLTFKEVTRRGKPVWKLHLTLKADRTYVIEAGSDSCFSKSVLAALAKIPPADLKQAVTLEVYPADNGESLFSNLYVQGQKVFAPWNQDTDWKLTAKAAVEAVALANGKS